MRPDWDSPAYI